MKIKIPSLLDLCIQTAIDNLRYIGDVGEVDTHLLNRILPHCTVDQLIYIENSTEGRDLSLVTDDLWKRFYEKQFGKESVDLVVRRMKQKQIAFKWQQLYEAKTKEREAFQNKLGQKLKQRYQEELDRSYDEVQRIWGGGMSKITFIMRITCLVPQMQFPTFNGIEKQSRQVKFTKKAPPSSNKRSFSFGSSSYNVSSMKSNIMKKAKIECLNSHEAAMRKNNLQRKSFSPQSISRSTKPSNFLKTSSASSAKLSKQQGRG